MLTPVTGGRKTNSRVDLGGIQVEVNGGGKTTGRVRFKKKPGEVYRPVGSWPGRWGDFTHECDGHSVDAKGDSDNNGEAILDRELMTLYVQHGVEMAYDDVSGAILDPHLVHKARGTEIGPCNSIIDCIRPPVRFLGDLLSNLGETRFFFRFSRFSRLA